MSVVGAILPPDAADPSAPGFASLVSFTPQSQPRVMVFLTLDGEFVVSEGVRPNVNRAVVSYREYDKIKDLREPGTLRFWMSDQIGKNGKPNPPSHTIKGVYIVDVEPTQYGLALGEQNKRWTEYRLFLADKRQRWCAPRGGILKSGPIAGRTQPVMVRTLMGECLAAMGESGYEIDSAVDLVPVPASINWKGNHAPTELDNLVKLSGCVLCLRSDGTVLIQKKGTGQVPHIPADRALPEIDMPSFDRRAKSVVITSAPNAVINTERIVGPNSETWEFVVQDLAGNWWEINQLFRAIVARQRLMWEQHQASPVARAEFFAQLVQEDVQFWTKNGGWRGKMVLDQVKRGNFNNFIASLGELLGDNPIPTPATLETLVRDDFEWWPGRHRETWRSQAFKCLRLNPSNYPALLLRSLHDENHDLKWLEAKSAYKSAVDGLWRNSTKFREFSVLQYEKGRYWKSPADLSLQEATIVRVAERLGTVQIEGVGTLQEAKFERLVYGQLRYTVSYESQVDGQTEYFTQRFSVDVAGNIIDTTLPPRDPNHPPPLDPHAGDDVATVSIPEMRLFRVDGVEQNREELAAKATALAPRYLAGGDGKARVLSAVGFMAAELSGQVNEIKFSQGDFKTTISVNGWNSPRAGGAAGGGGGGGELYPMQNQVMQDKIGQGEQGASQPVVPINVPPEGGRVSQTIVTDVQWDAAAGKLQKKTATGVFIECSKPSEWIDIEAAQDCPP